MLPTVSAAVNAGKKLVSRPVPVIAVTAVSYGLRNLPAIINGDVISPAHIEENTLAAFVGIALYLVLSIASIGMELCAVSAACDVLQDKKIDAEIFRRGFRPKAMLTSVIASLALGLVVMIPGVFLYLGAYVITLMPDMPNLYLMYWLGYFLNAVIMTLAFPAWCSAVDGAFIGKALGTAFSTAKRAGRSFWAALPITFVGLLISGLEGLLTMFGISGIALKIISAAVSIIASAYLMLFLAGYTQRFSPLPEKAFCGTEVSAEPEEEPEDDDAEPLPDWFSEIEQPVEGLFESVTYTCETENPCDLDPIELLLQNNANHSFVESFALRRTLKKYYTDCCDSITTYADYSSPRTESRREPVRIDGRQVVAGVAISTSDGNLFAVSVSLDVTD